MSHFGYVQTSKYILAGSDKQAGYTVYDIFQVRVYILRLIAACDLVLFVNLFQFCFSFVFSMPVDIFSCVNSLRVINQFIVSCNKILHFYRNFYRMPITALTSALLVSVSSKIHVFPTFARARAVGTPDCPTSSSHLVRIGVVQLSPLYVHTDSANIPLRRNGDFVDCVWVIIIISNHALIIALD